MASFFKSHNHYKRRAEQLKAEQAAGVAANSEESFTVPVVPGLSKKEAKRMRLEAERRARSAAAPVAQPTAPAPAVADVPAAEPVAETVAADSAALVTDGEGVVE